MEKYDEFVDQEVARAEMKLVCMWHPQNFGVELVMREAAPGHENDDPSHGICKECYARLKRGIAA